MNAHEKREVILRALDDIQDDTTIHQIQRLIERHLIEYALFRAGNNTTVAAKRLGCGRTTLVMKIKALINPPTRFRPADRIVGTE